MIAPLTCLTDTGDIMPTRFFRILATLYLAYLAACLLILLPAMNTLVPRAVEQATERPLSSELILFNPFTLALELRGVALGARTDSEPALVAFDRARANLSITSLWREGLVLDELLLQGLAVDIRQLDEGRFNFSDLLPEASAQDDEPTTLPALTVGRIDFHANHLGFSDESRSPAYRTHMDDLALTVSRLSTVREAGSPYDLSIVAEHGGRLDWRGTLSLATRESTGEIRLKAIDLRPVYRYLAPHLPFVVDSALLDTHGQYSATWRDTPAIQVTQGHIALRGLHMLPRDAESLPHTWVSLDAITLDGIDIDSKQRRVDVQALDIDALAVSGFSEGDTHSLLPMFLSTGDSPDRTRAATATAAKTQDPGEPWQISLQQLTTDNSRVRWRSAYTTPDVIELSPVSLTLSELAWPAQDASAIELSLRANDQSDLTASGNIDIGSGSGSVNYQLLGQPLAWFNPVVADFLRATIDKGELHLDGSVTLAGFAPATVRLDSGVDDFALRIFGRDASALGWESMRIPGIQVNLRERSVAVGRIELDGYSGSLHILPDGRLNAQMALPESKSPAGGEPARGNALQTAADDTTAEADATDWAISAAGLQLRNARIDFEDESLPLPFRALIGQLEGKVGTLDNAHPDKRTDVTMAGAVDGYAPVTIDGNIAPFAESTALAINVRFRGVDLANLTPYSGTYAGYAIDAGTLNLDLAYTLDGNQLRGENRAVISQMVLGEPIESERALDLPVKLAIALLTDTRGVIDLEVPIEGSIDNPEFSLGKIIAGALSNILTKAVTAPFRFLASLVGSDDDLQTMVFNPGSDAFAEDTRAKLDSLAQALNKRPALNVLVRGSIDPQADVRALKEQVLREELLATGLRVESLAEENATLEAALAERYAGIVEDRRDRTGTDATTDLADVSPADRREAVLATIDIAQDTLDALVGNRAAAVKRYLVNEGGIAADRVTVSGRADDEQLAGAVLDVGT